MSSLYSIGKLTLVEEPLEEIYGGTHQSSLATGDTLYASAPNTFSKRPIGASNTVYVSNGTTPDWATAGTVAIAYPDAIIDSGEPVGGIVYSTIASAITAGAANICIRSDHTEPAATLTLPRNVAIRINSNVALTLPATGTAITGNFNLTFEGEGSVSFTGAGTISISTGNLVIRDVLVTGTTINFIPTGLLRCNNVGFVNLGLFSFGNAYY